MVHEQKFKYLTCKVSVERIVLDLESEVAWVLFPLGVTFCHWDFFHIVKPLMPICTKEPGGSRSHMFLQYEIKRTIDQRNTIIKLFACFLCREKIRVILHLCIAIDN